MLLHVEHNSFANVVNLLREASLPHLKLILDKRVMKHILEFTYTLNNTLSSNNGQVFFLIFYIVFMICYVEHIITYYYHLHI